MLSCSLFDTNLHFSTRKKTLLKQGFFILMLTYNSGLLRKFIYKIFKI